MPSTHPRERVIALMRNVPSVYWFVGGTDLVVYDKAKEEGRIHELPVNHSPQFAPVLHPTLATGVEAMAAAAMACVGA